ncbi:MAG: ACT domain-containing protein [Candidatus Fimenecus sp.]
MRGIITVVGKDMVGILAKVSGVCAENGVNVIEVSQSILQDMFCMIMLVDFEKCTVAFTEFSDKVTSIGNEMALSIHVMHEDIFNSMHRI